MNTKLLSHVLRYGAFACGILAAGLLVMGCVSKCEPCKIAPDCCKPAHDAKGCKCGAHCRCEVCDCKPGAKCDRDCQCGPKGCKCDKACGCVQCDCVDGKRCAVNCTCRKAAVKKPGAAALELTK